MNIARVKWACRRGMLELDVLFQPFVNDHYEGLSDTDKQAFIRLLTSEDPELFAWFMGHEQCPDPELAAMVVKVRGRPAP
nr:succinate dehydrogenase assembly factor 2 [Shewanella sp. NIFS-20-20]